MLKKLLVGVLGLGVLTTSVLACDCQKVDNQALEVGRTQQVIFIINHFDSAKSVKLIDDVAATAKHEGKNQAIEARAFNKESVVINEANKMMSTSLNQDLRLENKNDLLK